MEENISTVVKNYLKSYDDDINDISLKELRLEVEKSLHLSPGTLLSDENKAILLKSFQDYKMSINTDSTRKRQKVALFVVDNENNLKRGRFSKKESETILSLCNQYLESHGLEASALLSYLKDFNDNSKSKSSFWTLLNAALPNRHRESIYRRARVLLMRQEKPAWTQEEKDTLMRLVSVSVYQHRSLFSDCILPNDIRKDIHFDHLFSFGRVEIHGTDWKTIARTLSRVSGDVRTTYINNLPTDKKGKFSLKEDKDLVDAIIKELKIDTTKDEFPSSGIPWTQIANKLGDIRRPIDYLRRWLTLRPKLIHTAATNLSKESQRKVIEEEDENENEEEENDEDSSNEENILVNSNKSIKSALIHFPAENRSEQVKIGKIPVSLCIDTVTVVSSHKDGNMSDLELLQYLKDSEAEDESEILFADIDREYNNKSRQYANKRWISLKKRCPSHVKSFVGCIDFLLSKQMNSSKDGDDKTTDENENENENEMSENHNPKKKKKLLINKKSSSSKVSNDSNNMLSVYQDISDIEENNIQSNSDSNHESMHNLFLREQIIPSNDQGHRNGSINEKDEEIEQNRNMAMNMNMNANVNNVEEKEENALKQERRRLKKEKKEKRKRREREREREEKEEEKEDIIDMNEDDSLLKYKKKKKKHKHKHQDKYKISNEE